MVKNIIFDFGGVVLDLDFKRMVEQFEALGIHDFGQYFTLKEQVGFFENLELGKIEPAEFYEKFRQQTLSALTDQQIEQAWNLILTDFNPERMDFLSALTENVQLYLFSNTNAIHAKCFENRCVAQTGRPLTDYFKEIFYSHELHLRKPTVESFQTVLAKANLVPRETLFVDDNADNIAGAKAAGLKTYHLQAPEQITDLDFSKF